MIKQGDLVTIGDSGVDVWSVAAIVVDDFHEFAKLERGDIYVMIPTNKLKLVWTEKRA